ncbi:hypothetical protein Hdeb2414_s0010g00334741 [Helianthus debilis subsp. tardiflorus]
MFGKLIVVVFDVFGREVVRTKAAIQAVLEPIEKHYLDEDGDATTSKIVVGDRAVHVQFSGLLDQPKPSVKVIGYVLMLN